MTTALILSQYFVFQDPPSRNTCLSLKSIDWQMHILQPDMGKHLPHTAINAASVTNSKIPNYPSVLSKLNSFGKMWNYRTNAKKIILKHKPDWVIAMHQYDLASLPWPKDKYGYKLGVGILDIPPKEYAGVLGNKMLTSAYSRLKDADVAWASDRYKANIATELSNSSKPLLVCHNVPHTDYLPKPAGTRIAALREKLRSLGATIGATDGLVVLRAGAIGEWCGIDESLDAFKKLPANCIFLMMGRPEYSYAMKLKDKITQMNLSKQVFFWDRPDDNEWKMALQGSDIGHLIHTVPSDKSAKVNYELNSSLSNNRLFQYMAAGLPVIAYDDPRMQEIYDEVPCYKVARLSHLTDDLHKHILDLANNPDERARMGRAARLAHEQKYNWNFQFAPVLNQFQALTT